MREEESLDERGLEGLKEGRELKRGKGGEKQITDLSIAREG